MRLLTDFDWGYMTYFAPNRYIRSYWDYFRSIGDINLDFLCINGFECQSSPVSKVDEFVTIKYVCITNNPLSESNKADEKSMVTM